MAMRRQAGPPLERPQHQLLAAEKVEAGPIEIGQGVKEQRRHVRAVGDQIALAG
jgi:hypothetical protein